MVLACVRGTQNYLGPSRLLVPDLYAAFYLTVMPSVIAAGSVEGGYTALGVLAASVAPYYTIRRWRNEAGYDTKFSTTLSTILIYAAILLTQYSGGLALFQVSFEVTELLKSEISIREILSGGFRKEFWRDSANVTCISVVALILQGSAVRGLCLRYTLASGRIFIVAMAYYLWKIEAKCEGGGVCAYAKLWQYAFQQWRGRHVAILLWAAIATTGFDRPPDEGDN